MDVGDMSALMVNVPGNGDLADPMTWGARGQRLWASMPEEFWVYVYKVQMCRRRYSHDWTACPYVHNSERARRRDPRRFHYIDTPCPGGGRPRCRRGLYCQFAHGVFKLFLHPSRFRTSMCDAGSSSPRRICFFAHFAAELRGNGHIAATSVPLPMVLSPPCAPSPPPASAPVAVDSRDQLLDDPTLQSRPNSHRLLSLYAALGAEHRGDEHMAAAVSGNHQLFDLTPQYSAFAFGNLSSSNATATIAVTAAAAASTTVPTLMVSSADNGGEDVTWTPW